MGRWDVYLNMMGLASATVWEGAVSLDSETAGLRRGDPQAFEALLTRYQHRLYRYLLRLVREPAMAEDLFQQTWLRVVERTRQYDPRRSFEAWLFAVAHNLAVDTLRRYRPESLDEPVESRGNETRGEQIAGGGPSALERVMQQERSARVARALEQMPMIYREVLSLRFEEELKIEEIAAVLGAPLSTVKTRLRRGLEALRRILVSAPQEGLP